MNFIILDEKIAGITVVGGLEGRHAEGRHTENLEDWCTKCGRVAAADADFVCFHPVTQPNGQQPVWIDVYCCI